MVSAKLSEGFMCKQKTIDSRKETNVFTKCYISTSEVKEQLDVDTKDETLRWMNSIVRHSCLGAYSKGPNGNLSYRCLNLLFITPYNLYQI